jgi:hypothetical protein
MFGMSGLSEQEISFVVPRLVLMKGNDTFARLLIYYGVVTAPLSFGQETHCRARPRYGPHGQLRHSKQLSAAYVPESRDTELRHRARSNAVSPIVHSTRPFASRYYQARFATADLDHKTDHRFHQTMLRVPLC